jgi:predicted SAM-dependent methyltransferase
MFEPARERQITCLTIKSKILSRLFWINPTIRKLNPLLKYINLQLSFSRYQAAVYVYPFRADRILYKNIKDTDEYLVNFGSGGFYHQLWDNYDYPGASPYYKYLQGKSGKDFTPIDLSLNNNLPLKSDQVTMIYCAHTIEHLPDAAVEHFITECARILKPGGRLRLVYPDFSFDVAKAKLLYEQLGGSDASFIKQCKYTAVHMFQPSEEFPDEYIVQSIINSEFDAEKIFELLKIKDSDKGRFRPANPEYHLSFWSHSKLARLCNGLGFKLYIPELAGQSDVNIFKNTCIFDTTEPQLSSYGELVKM